MRPYDSDKVALYLFGFPEGFVDGLARALEVKFGKEGVKFSKELTRVKNLWQLQLVYHLVREGFSIDKTLDVLVWLPHYEREPYVPSVERPLSKEEPLEPITKALQSFTSSFR
jgi:hypothetical protein